jgi:tetratricopeptide (TPR) repeat protein
MPKRTSKIPAVAAITVLLLAACGSESSNGTADQDPNKDPDKTTKSTPQPPDSRAATLIQDGITQAEQNQTGVAAASFNAALALDPDNKYAWYNLGVIAQQQSDPAAAVNDYDHAIQIDPNYSPALYNKALTVQTKDPETAEQLYRKAITINPQAATAYLNLGLLLKSENAEESARDLAKAIALDPTLAQDIPRTTQGAAG